MLFRSKQAVAQLMPYMEAERAANGGAERASAGKILMATVKGDVHDIGKNIVGVVLACNNYEVVDLGVMVPAKKILETAREVEADVIGLSGLITPSLEEMTFVAAEMEREGFDIPLLIGGATTSRVHTAVKIHPNYSRGQAVYVTDASRAVGVVGSLLSETARGTFIDGIKTEYQKVAETHAKGERDKQRLPLAKARANAPKIDWASYDPPKPQFTGTRVMKKAVAYLLPYMEEEKKRAEAEGKIDKRGKGKILMATVKGDVHDIGKNIVGVVLACNNYDKIGRAHV